MTLVIRPLSYRLGAEVVGVDIGKPIDDETFREIHAAFLEHCVLLFRGQPLTREQYIAFSRRFGELDGNESAPRDRHPDFPEIMVNTNKPRPGSHAVGKGTLVWHTDRAWSCNPTMATILRAVEIPEIGGDTMFTNMRLAYDALSDGMKKLIGDLYCVHSGGVRMVDDSTPERLAATKHLSRTIAHPVVRVHPETGRKALYLSEKVEVLVGLKKEESMPLIAFLLSHAGAPQFVYRHQWRKDDLLMWDNRCTMHKGLGDYDKTQTRYHDKISVKGTSSGYVYEGPLQ